MLNSQLNDFASAAHLTQVASYFDIVDAAVKTGDTNKRYTISTNTSTAPSPPIAEGTWTNIHIAPTADNMCDLYNSFVEFKMTVALKTNYTDNTTKPTAGAGNKPAFWVGFKDAMDAIEAYQIVANGQVIYTQPHAIEESYITNLASTDMVRNKDIFSKATAKNIMDRVDTLMVGGLFELDSAKVLNAQTALINLNLKVDIRRFLPLSGIKYLPAFVGNLELRVKFSTAGLVCLPMPWYDTVNQLSKSNTLTQDPPNITNCFTPLGKDFTTITGYDSSTKKITSAVISCVPSSMSVSECFSVLSCFGIDDAIYQQLVQRYTGQSLSFPTQTLTFQAMNGSMGNGKTGVDLALTSTPRFVDTIFILFPYDTNYRTCYYNPLFDACQITMGGYGTMPDIPVSSYGVINYEMLTNALNGNNDLTGLNKDVMISATLNPSLTKAEQTVGTKPHDVSNFVLAYPVSVDNTFQQGQTSSAPITYQFKATMNENSYYKDATSCVPLMGFLKDSVFAIQIRPNGPPLIALDEFDISSPAGA